MRLDQPNFDDDAVLNTELEIENENENAANDSIFQAEVSLLMEDDFRYQ